MGRFMSPDPSGLYFANPENPQTLNLYSYVGNNPLVFLDPDGLQTVPDATCGWVRCVLGPAIKKLFSGGGEEQSSPGGGGIWETEPNYTLHPGVSSYQSQNRDDVGIHASLQAVSLTKVKDNNGPCPQGCYYEYGGRILKKGSWFYFTDPVTFNHTGHFWTTHVAIPFGYRKAGSYHSHPPHAEGVGYGTSMNDKNFAHRDEEPGYMGESVGGRVWVDSPNEKCDREPCGEVIYDPNQ